MSYYAFDLTVFFINVMICTVSLKFPAVLFKKLYKIFCFHNKPLQ